MPQATSPDISDSAMSTHPHRHTPKSSETPFQTSGGYHNSQQELNFEWNVQQARLGVKVRRSHTFGHIVYDF